MGHQKLRFGILGCGDSALIHRKAVDACTSTELVAICDVDEGRARRLIADAKAASEIRVFRDYEKLVNDSDVDVVCICTPSGLHADGVIAAAQAGKHVFCEKPLELTSERMTRMIGACRDARVKLGCVFQYRTRPDLIAARDLIQRSALGLMVLGDAHLKKYRSTAYYENSGWRGSWALDGGGVLMNQAIHGIDLLLWLMNDDVECVFARAERKVRSMEGQDTAVACLQFKSGAYGVIEAATSCNPGEPERIHLHGSCGTIGIESWAVRRLAITNGPESRASYTPRAATIVRETATSGAPAPTDHAWLIENMVSAILRDHDPYIPGESARKAVDLILAIQRSVETGLDVRLDTI